jgi:uncharacterized membrane protein HdeD (DUF308 family)
MTMLGKVQKMVDNLWWMFVLQGVLTVVFGLVALFWPGITLVTLVYLFAAYILALGVVLFLRGAFRSSSQASWWFTALMGIVGIGFGVYLIAYPQVAIGTFLGILGVLLLARGVFDLFLAAYVVKQTDGRLLWIISGGVGIIAAIVLWRYPVETGVAFVWVLGLYALIAGVVSLIYAYRARGFLDKMKIELKFKK